MQAARPVVDRTGDVPVLASRNAPVPYVHFTSPAWRQDSANSAACWSTTSPPTGTVTPPNTDVSPTTRSHATTSGNAYSVSPKTSSSAGDHAARSRSSRAVRDAVAASVTKPPPQSRWSSHISVVVTTSARTPSRAATGSSAPRSTGRARGRCAAGRARRHRRRASGRKPLQNGRLARRSPVLRLRRCDDPRPRSSRPGWPARPKRSAHRPAQPPASPPRPPSARAAQDRPRPHHLPTPTPRRAPRRTTGPPRHGRAPSPAWPTCPGRWRAHGQRA